MHELRNNAENVENSGMEKGECLDKIIVLQPGNISKRLGEMLNFALGNYEYEIVRNSEEIDCLRNKRILFAVELGDSGINIELYKMLEKISISNNLLENSVGSILINSNNEFYTRDISRKIILYSNMAGCTFPGRPISEATGSLKTYNTYQKIYNKDLLSICKEDCRKTVDRMMNFSKQNIKNPSILALHASNYKTSNTLSLWKKIKKNLDGYNIEEIHIENGTVNDCKACSYKECKHYSESNNCFYGGIMVDEVYPSILKSDILIMLCPNYNDSISANMSAVINRLTALYRKTKFYDKYIYSIIVSGHSGSDIIAQQLISALNINKTFILPPRFALMETANDIGDIDNINNIEITAKNFAENMINNIIYKNHS
ncbi:MAG: NAD(P)H-dependent oxidoreductase [Tissierellia bacterium]|nr:NAD(P)H-dependent oxidoreductase [Tissierellia bacterium]MDD4780816.1 NAD(P)H-dependent oxidoreductase [Tissierellia bacterium]